jgi:hypothetical protein
MLSVIELRLNGWLGALDGGAAARCVGLMTARQLPDPGEERERGRGIGRPVLRLDRAAGTGNH